MYTLRELLANPGNYGGSRAASKIKYIVVHYTANDGDRAQNNANYFHDRVVKASAHYFVDDTTVWQSVPDLRVAWAVGGKKYSNAAATGGGKMYGKITNTNSISIEMCDTIKNGVYQASKATLENTYALIRMLMKKYNIPISNVYRHFDVTGKHCPSYLVSATKWAEFKTQVVHTMDNKPASYAKDAVQWARANGILQGDVNGDLKLNSPLTRQQFVAMLYRYDQKRR